MREWMLEYLRCPATKAKLRLAQAVWRGNDVQSGVLVSHHDTLAYPIIGGIPRMLRRARDDYAIARTIERHAAVHPFPVITCLA